MPSNLRKKKKYHCITAHLPHCPLKSRETFFGVVYPHWASSSSPRTWWHGSSTTCFKQSSRTSFARIRCGTAVWQVGTSIMAYQFLPVICTSCVHPTCYTRRTRERPPTLLQTAFLKTKPGQFWEHFTPGTVPNASTGKTAPSVTSSPLPSLLTSSQQAFPSHWIYPHAIQHTILDFML